MWSFKKTLYWIRYNIASVLCFGFWPQDMCDLNSPTKDWTHTPCIGRWSLNPWTTRKVPGFFFFLNRVNPNKLNRTGAWASLATLQWREGMVGKWGDRQLCPEKVQRKWEAKRELWAFLEKGGLKQKVCLGSGECSLLTQPVSPRKKSQAGQRPACELLKGIQSSDG